MTLKLRGLRVRRRLAGVWRGLLRCRRRCRPRRDSYLRIDQSPQREQTTRDCTITGKLLSWGRRLCPFPLTSRAQVPPHPPFMDQHVPAKPPKGHLIVYVRREDPEEEEEREASRAAHATPQRVVVPVVYFNHPLFAELLREAEREYGFHHPGGIMLPCPYSDFESVRSRVAAAASAGLCCHSSPGRLKLRWALNRSLWGRGGAV